MFPQAKASGIDTVSLGAALLKRKAELLANPGTPPVATGANAEGSNEQDDLPADEQPSLPKISSARAKRPRRPAATKHVSKKASHKAN